ncbi:MAG: methyltransferase [Candidatus Firestonebacteria bacterium RIFOXYC2_FULL_39_67]|nr:MAG: methyltransferase [Candidatus Firestonebacteria bacterium RIFOXYD2_FULL_39_29]OGF54265.1 MAG: methyltransferase [Candidatus Firestonebacteria bacterium RIFOXYC2_FULL_39_67]OGF56889.1 MAG: methyltransferase [Candidatus Firestonebacteria bacterium RifOxyC12_full_39_7]
MADFKEISDAVIKGQAPKVKELVQKAVNEKVTASDILQKGLIVGMGFIGERFKKNEVYVPEVLIAARAMKAGMEILKPLLATAGVQPLGVVVLGTVKGDLHDIGKNLVGMMLEGAGFKVVDVGIDASPEKFINATKESKASVIAMSALLTTTMVAMKSAIEELKKAGVTAKVMIGGAPVTQAYADEIGASGYAPDAASAVDKAKELLKK